MKIAVLGWGSLIWDQRGLKIINNKWYENGPSLPIEFARISKGGRLTLVIKPDWQEVITLYALSVFENIGEAIENLKDREETSTEKIGYYNFISEEKNIRSANESIILKLISWKEKTDIDGVIWTDLPPNFSIKSGLRFNQNSINKFLNELGEDEFFSSKQYVENTHPQVETRFRNEIQQMLNEINR